MDERVFFEKNFAALTSNAPLSWQRRLFLEHFARGDIPLALDIPTGLGKTSVIAIWLIARALAGGAAALPRRLVYVVDRRAVVDQATSEAEKLRRALESEAKHLKQQIGLGDRSLPISTLRGAHLDNREWLDDPAVPAVIVGTVDMIGSRILFSGYGVSRKMRPYHAGLLGADTLVVLDEAHLVPPFQALIEQVGRRTIEDFERAATRFRMPVLRTMALSATGRDTRGPVFRLEDQDLEQDKIARQRIDAPKWIKLAEVSGDPAAAMAERAWQLSDQQHRVIVFCNSRKLAQDISDDLEERLKKILGKEAAERGTCLELIVGARRVRERELLADSRVFRRFARLPQKDEQSPETGPAFLVATSAGEVGVDIDSDHMVCDLVAWERMVQRLGRVNRRGELVEGSTIDVFVAAPDKEAETPTGTPPIKECRAPFEYAAWPKRDARLDASLGSLRRLRKDAEFRKLSDRATTEEPLRPTLTPSLLDAWSMTTLRDHTGRPDVEPWLRGWIDNDKDLPQTEVLWRRHLPIRNGEDVRQAMRELTSFFEAAPAHMSEILQTETYRVVEMLRARARAALKRVCGGAQAAGSRAHVGMGSDQDNSDFSRPLTRWTVGAIVLGPDGSVEQLLTLEGIDGRDSKRLHGILAERRVVLDARLAGLAPSGLLDSRNDEPPATIDGERVSEIKEEGGATLWSDERLRQRGLGFRVTVARHESGAEGWKTAYRRFIEEESQEAEDPGERLEWRVEEWVGDGSADNDLALASAEQTLEHHRDRVVVHATAIARRLNLPDGLRTMLVIAAQYHDCGKARPIWQRYAGNYNFVRDRTRALAKFAIWPNPQLLKVGGDIYRHEFGSLHDAIDDKAFDHLPPALRRLGLHLIASHHGNARPTIFAYDEAQPADRSIELAEQMGRDFVTLQADWGTWGLAWWEALLRAADVAASREKNEGEVF